MIIENEIMNGFHTMIEFYIWFSILFIFYFLILFLYLQFSDKKVLYENIIGFGALFMVIIHVLLFLILMFQDITLHPIILPLWLTTLGLPIIIISIIILFSSLVYVIIKFGFKSEVFTRYKENMTKRLIKRSKIRNDIYRKLAHVLIFIVLFLLWYIGIIVVKEFSGSVEGMIPYENNMFYLYLKIFTEPNSMSDVLFALGWFYYLLFFFFYSFTLFMLAMEFTRKTKYLTFPFNFICSIYLCDDEEEGYGAYLYFTLGQMFASFLCPPMVYFAILGMSSIADLMTSQIGIRYGKNKIKINKSKTWEGTFAGCITCFIICFFFLGTLWAVIFTLVFFIIDVLTKKPINISDNLLIPISCALIYVLIRFLFNLNYFTIFLSWIQ
jgi:dolichol kinase